MTTAHEHAVRLVSLAVDSTGLTRTDIAGVMSEVFTQTDRVSLATAQAQVTAGILLGVETAVSHLLTRTDLLAVAYIRARCEAAHDPKMGAFTARDVGLDVAAMMARTGCAVVPGS